MDTLRPRWDASRERSVTCPRPGPRIEHRGARVEKTQLGQGLFALESTSRELRRRGAAVPGCGHRTDAGEKGAARPGSIWRADSGEAAKTRSGQPAMQMADRRVSKLRPSCLKSYAAGMGRRSEGMGTPTVVSKGRNAGRTPAFVEASLLGGRWESMARSLWYIPGSGKGPPGF